MIGFNGGLLGKTRTTSIHEAVGVWSPNEQIRYKAAGAWPIPGLVAVTYLVIGGGGGGGGAAGCGGGVGAGGGAGGYLTATASNIVSNFSYTVTVGTGGLGKSDNTQGGNGGASVFGDISATGGGGGGAANGGPNGRSGGSGGGPSFNGTAGAGTSGQGNNGGASPSANDAGSGGGGAGAVGGQGSSVGGAGGAGLSSSITGSAVTRAGGGGGGDYGGSFGTGGSGGGGNGGTGTIPGVNGTANTGGGGGGSGTGASSVQKGGDGGSGVVILRYSSAFTISNPGGGLTFSTSTVGSDKVTTFTAGTGTIQFGESVAGEDPSLANVSLLLRGNGTNGSTTFTDGSNNNFTIAPAGNAQISTTQSKFGGASMYFDGAGDYIQSPANSAFAYGTGDFTVEMWLYPESGMSGLRTFYNNLLSGGSDTGFYLWMHASGAGFYSIDLLPSNATYIVNSSANDIQAGQWSHFALTRSGTTIRGFVNGTQIWTASYSLNVTVNQMRLASPLGNTSGSDWNGYIDDLRITKGVARYTANFTPPGAL